LTWQLKFCIIYIEIENKGSKSFRAREKIND